MDGGEDADHVVGGGGRDQLFGGDGPDTIRYDANDTTYTYPSGTEELPLMVDKVEL